MKPKVDLVLMILMIAVLIQLDIPLKQWFLNTEGVAVLGIVMSIFIGFRNTQPISSWWEARKI